MTSPLLRALKHLPIETWNEGVSPDECLQVSPTIYGHYYEETGKSVIRFGRPVYDIPKDWKRSRDESGKRIPVVGDIVCRPVHPEGPVASMILWCDRTGSHRPALRWVTFPSMAEFQEWTLDSVCLTPDGEKVEPDHPASWLRLAGLV